jgi:hypothetical protein
VSAERRAEILAAPVASRVVLPFQPSPQLEGELREIRRWRLSLEKDALSDLRNYLSRDSKTLAAQAYGLSVRYTRRGCSLTQLKALFAALGFKDDRLGDLQTLATRARLYAKHKPDPEIPLLQEHLAEYDVAMGVEVATAAHAELMADALADATKEAEEGRRIAAEVVPYAVDGVVPSLGVLGFLVAYTKVGKTSLCHALGAAVAQGTPFLDRATQRVRVLYIAAEDPPEYTAWVARHLVVGPGRMSFYRRSVVLDETGLTAICAAVRHGGFGLVIVASWQAVIRGLVRDENDNAGAVVVVERVKAATRELGVPWVIEAHSGKGEDQEDEADPTRALRGASSAAGAADFVLSLRYADGAFGRQRRLSGKGRFVSLAPLLLNYDEERGVYTSLGSTKGAAREETWNQIVEKQALSAEPRSVDEIAKTAGIVSATGKVTGAGRRVVKEALWNREGVTKTEEVRRGKKTTLYRLSPGQAELREVAAR